MRRSSIIFWMMTLLSVSTFAQHNQELQKMADQDQQSRFSGNIDWIQLNREDSLRRVRVLDLLEKGALNTGTDFFNAGIVFQHGIDTTASALAVRCFKKAIAMDSTLNKWWYAAAVDRDLMRRGEPQIYGTQFVQNASSGGKLKRYKIDSTQVTDEERVNYGVETLAQQREKERMMNLKSPGSFYASSSSISETIDLLKREFEKGADATYNVSEQVINSFGYQLISQQKLQDALEIFQLNIQFYPESANVYDSYGEALRLDGKLEESIIAYKTSLKYDPLNVNAQKAIQEMSAQMDSKLN